jgi:hypothetical protein
MILRHCVEVQGRSENSLGSNDKQRSFDSAAYSYSPRRHLRQDDRLI